VLRLARSELKRMTGGLLPKLTIIALTMVPLLYGAVYLYATGIHTATWTRSMPHWWWKTPAPRPATERSCGPART
jgi:hypothetical protein